MKALGTLNFRALCQEYWRPLLSRPPSLGPSRTRRGWVKPTCSRIRLKLLSLGACPKAKP
jgi:hypothetical protein